MKTITVMISVCVLLLSSLLSAASGTMPDRSIPVPVRMGTILYVGGSGPGNYTRIQDAVDSASAGDTIYVYEGSYPESVKVNTSLVLLAENQQAIIDVRFLYAPAVVILADAVSVEGFTIIDYQTELGKASIMVLADDCRILGNSISSLGTGDSGIGLIGAEGAFVKNNTITHQTFGVSLVNASHNIIANDTIIDDVEGMSLFDSNDNVVENCTISNDANGVLLSDSCRNTIRGNTIWRCSYDGISLNYLSTGSFGNVITGNSFVGNGRDTSFVVKTGRNTFDGNYWHRYLNRPKFIVGGRIVYTLPGVPFHFPGLNVVVPWVAVDWHPLKTPG